MAEQRSTLIIEISSEQAARNARALDRELQSIERTGNYATTSMNSMSVAARQLAGYLAGVVTVGTAIAKMDTYTGLQNRLKLVTKSQTELNTAMTDTFAIAQKTASSWDSTAMVYQRFADNAQRLGITMKTTAELTETVSKAISISGGSAASAEAALMQFGQALASGVLRGEEFNSIAEQAPGLLKAIAQGMGVNIGQLRSMAGEGKITGDALVSALTNAKTSVDELFGKTDFTIAQSFTQLSNAVTKFVGEAGKGSGAASAISGSLSFLADNLDTVTNVAMIGGAYWVGTYIPALYKSVVAGYGKATQLVEQTAIQWAAIEAEKVAAAQELAGAEAKLVNLQATRAQLVEELKLELARKKKQISDQGAINSDIRMGLLRQQQAAINTELTATENALAAARTRSVVANNATMGAGRGLLGLLGGAGGLVGIVAAVGASMLLMRDNTDSATNSLNIQKQSVREIASEYSKLSAAKLISEMDEIDKRIKKSQSDASKARDSLLGMVTGSSESISNEEIKRQNLMLKQLKKIKEDGLSTAAALQNLSKSKLFTDGEIKSAQRYFAQLDEGISSAREFGYQKELANSYMAKASGLYEENADKISKLTNESERLNESYSNSKESIVKSAESFLQISENSGASAKQLIIAKNALDSYSKGTISATQLSRIFLENLPIPQKTIDSFIAQSKQADNYKNSVAGVNIELKKQIDFRNTYLSQHQGVLAAEKEVTEEKRKQLANEQRLSELRKSANKSMLDDNYWINTYNRELKNIGGDKQKASTFADFALNWRKENKIERDVQLTTEQAKILNDLWVLDQKRKTLSDEASKSEKDRTKEMEAQQKLQEKQAVALAGNNEQTRNMLRVYQAFRNTGLGDKQARVMTAQVGRENDFRNSDMFGSHKDANNGYTNTGFISWQKGRSTQLMQFLQGQGVLDKNGKIQQSQDALDAMAKFLMQEIATGKSYGKTKNALNDDNLSYRELEKIVGQNFIGWDYNGKKLGKDKASQHLSKQDNYFNQISKILGANPENVMSSIKDLSKFEDEAFKARAKTEDEIKQLQAKYDTEAITRSKAREEAINEATVLGQLDLIPKIKERYNAQDKLAKLQQDYELNGYKYTEDQKLIYQRDSAKEQLDAEGKYSDEVKALHKKSIDDLYDYEIKKTKLVRESALFEHKRVLMLEADAIKQKYQLERREIELNAKAKGYDAEYLKAYNASYIRGGVGIDDNHTSRTKNQFLPNTPYTDKDSDLEKLKAYSGLLLQSQGIMQTAVNMAKNGRGEDSKTFKMLGGGLEAITGIQQLTSARSGQKSELGKLNEERDNALKQLQERLDAVKNAEDASHQERLDAEKVFQSAKEQLQKEYSVKSVEAVKADNQNQLAFYGQMLSQTSVVWSDMTQLIKDAKGENSKTFRAMFLAQQSMAIAQQIINTELAAGATTAQTGIFGMPAAAVIRGVGYASVGLIAAQTISEFSNGGYTGAGGKYDPAGIVHKGEVVFSQEDIARWGGVGNVEKLRKNGGYSDGGVVGNSYNQGRQYDAISQARANVALQPNITINNYSNETVETSTAPNGDLLVQIGKMMDKKIDDGVDKGIQRNLKQGYPLARAIKNKG
ncbi:MAG: tape measure protein [Acinetobacter sp.]|nr:tape measure protein [Acinetobacter sp.]